jgi:hypothetical protein
MSKKNDRCLLCKVGTLVEVATYGVSKLVCDYCGAKFMQEPTKIEVKSEESEPDLTESQRVSGEKKITK